VNAWSSPPSPTGRAGTSCCSLSQHEALCCAPASPVCVRDHSRASLRSTWLTSDQPWLWISAASPVQSDNWSGLRGRSSNQLGRVASQLPSLPWQPLASRVHLGPFPHSAAEYRAAFSIASLLRVPCMRCSTSYCTAQLPLVGIRPLAGKYVVHGELARHPLRLPGQTLHDLLAAPALFQLAW
jgi:hypothetical protein